MIRRSQGLYWKYQPIHTEMTNLMNDQELVDAANQSAYAICMRLINNPALVDESVVPSLLDHAALLQKMAQRLADSGVMGSKVFARTPSLGIVWLEIVEEGFYIFQVDGTSLDIKDLPVQDREAIFAVYDKAIQHRSASN
jgi:hypothetical protein